jgi:regulator of sigma E protease
MEVGQQVGMALLVMLMAFALYNDINRLISG